jgi:hypothetical protein
MTGRLIGLLLLAVVWADAAQPLNVHIVCHTHDGESSARCIFSVALSLLC